MKSDSLLARLSESQKQLTPLPGEVAPEKALVFLANTMARFSANHDLTIQENDIDNN